MRVHVVTLAVCTLASAHCNLILGNEEGFLAGGGAASGGGGAAQGGRGGGGGGGSTCPACDDGVFCNGVDSCDEHGECTVHEGDPCAGGGQCADLCYEQRASCFAPPGTSCDDGLFCNGDDSCDGAGECEEHTGDPCIDGTSCADTCNETADDCFDLAGGPCGNSNTTECSNPDSCDGSGFCSPNHAPNGTACGNSGTTGCTNPDTCNAGICQPNHRPAGTTCAGTGMCDGNGLCN